MQGDPGLLQPWLVLTIISMVTQVLGVIGSFLFFQSFVDSFGWYVGPCALVALVMQAYLFIMVHSLR